MIKNWFRTAWRNLRKNRTASAINIVGLAIGFSSCLLIALFIRHELSYDDFEVKGNRIVRCIMEYRFDGGGEIQRGNFTSTKVAPTFKRTFPEVESAVRMYMADYTVKYQEKLFNEKRFMFADSSFFDIFSCPLLEGNVATGLSGPRKVILTASTARRYFGAEEPLGKMIRVGNDTTAYQVTGLMKDLPSNSQFKFDFLASFSSLFANQEETWWDANYGTFLLLRRPSDIASLQPKVTAFMKQEMKGQGAMVNFLLEPFMRIHLYSPYVGWEAGTSIVYIYILGGVALLILVIACSTYINLSTARSVDRAKEVGVRKVIGAGRSQLFWQFIGESFLLCMFAVVLSLLVVLAVLPAFNRLADRELPFSSLGSAPFLLLAFGIAAAVSLLAGSYPALVLSRFHPIKVLKGTARFRTFPSEAKGTNETKRGTKFRRSSERGTTLWAKFIRNTRSGQGLRQSLIVFQFVISVFLIVSTVVMQRQLSYIRNRSLGYDRDHVLVLPMDRTMLPHIGYIKQQFLSNPDVVRLSSCASTPVSIYGGYNMRSAAMPENQQMAVFGNPIDPDYLRTTGIQLVAGEDITEQDMRDAHPDQYAPSGAWLPEDQRPAAAPGSAEPKRFYHFLLNETAAKELGWTPKQAVGKQLFMDASRPGIVKGVVKDFNFQTLHNPIKGLVLFTEMRGYNLLVRVTGEHLPQTLAFLEAKWKQLEPDKPYEARFLDEDYNAIYTGEQRLGKVMNLFSGIAIVLACLGLFGLSSYAAKQRVREIGIRKVLGAPLGHLALLLSANFLRLAVVAILISFPLAWLAMDKWLQDFQYRTTMSWWVFVLAGIVVLAITLATVSIQALRTALLNPVKNLKTE
jgi:putative ABC transport system permease protein